jgi:hypothetical protein
MQNVSNSFHSQRFGELKLSDFKGSILYECLRTFWMNEMGSTF